MLPRPVTSSRLLGTATGVWSSHTKPSFISNSRDALRIPFLLSRSRITNLGVIILFGLLLISFTANIKQYTRDAGLTVDRERDLDELGLLVDPSLGWNHRKSLPPSISGTIGSSAKVQGASHLVVVAGHAIWAGCDADTWHEESDWVLNDYQKGGGSIDAFYSHIVRGVEVAQADPSAVLIFSGGVTRPSSPAQSEAQSYLRLAIESGLLPNQTVGAGEPTRAFAEDYALDSFQNLLFAIARFHEVTLSDDGVNGAWPNKITVVGFEMKRRRFEELHRKALRWSKDSFSYIGVDATHETSRKEGWEGEERNGYIPYSKDLYGCHGDLLAKRRARNPFTRIHPYYTSAPELRRLFDWCPGREDATDDQAILFTGSLPWE